MRRPIVRFGQHGVEHVSNPAVTCGTVVRPVGIELLEELSDVHARTVGEVLRRLSWRWIVGAKIAADQVGKRFRVPPPEFHIRPSGLTTVSRAGTRGLLISGSWLESIQMLPRIEGSRAALE